MKTNEELVIAYAQNRTELREMQKIISTYCWTEIEGDKCLMELITDCRKDYFDAEIDEYGCTGYWPGWNEILCEFPADHPVRQLASMFDQKKAIQNNAGNIKRAIAARGRKLLRNKS